MHSEFFMSYKVLTQAQSLLPHSIEAPFFLHTLHFNYFILDYDFPPNLTDVGTVLLKSSFLFYMVK